MSIVSQHLQNLLGQKDARLWGGYVNMLKLLESMFLSPKHWVLEFLQNAEDASAKTISIRLGEASLSIINDGDIFYDDDFNTICDVNSRKLPSLGFRGYIGIGFKSIFRITNRIDVHSGDFHFCFDKEYWDDSRRKGTPIVNWPWEILPVEINPVELQGSYTTGFFVPLESTKGQEVLEEVGKFLSSNDFPKEVILLLEKVETIELQTPQLSFTITKELVESETLAVGKKELFLVRKQFAGQQYSEETFYLLFRKTVRVQDDIRRDTETELVRRSEISEREIGLVFGLDSEKNLQFLSGKLSGVYSFLPVEGEQTGLPFGIFGDFIPQPGRDLINYGAKWNHWMCDEVAEFFKQVVRAAFLLHPMWRFFPAELIGRVEYSSTAGPGKEFWDTKLRDPIKQFLDAEDLYPDDDGGVQRLDELISVEDEVIQVVGKDTFKALTGKKMAHPSIENKIQLKIGGKVDIYELLHRRELLESLKDQPEKLASLYRLIAGLTQYYIGGRKGQDISLRQLPFVLADDGEFYPPNQMVTLEMDVAHVPEFLRAVLLPLEEKKRLHPEIAKDPEAVSQLEHCNLDVINIQTAMLKLKQFIEEIKTPEKCQETWKYPDDLIQATLFLITEDGSPLEQLVAQDGTILEPQKLFTWGAPLDWSPLWEAQCLPGFQPIHEKYFNKEWMKRYGLQWERLHQYLEELGVHGFRRDKDSSLIQIAGENIAKLKLQEPEQGHTVADVTQRDKLGYDLQCQGHCTKVFEVKGMTEPHDVPLEESQVSAAQQKKDDYILICVYNLPNHPDKIGYKEIPNPQTIWNPVEKAKVPKDKWLTA